MYNEENRPFAIIKYKFKKDIETKKYTVLLIADNDKKMLKEKFMMKEVAALSDNEAADIYIKTLVERIFKLNEEFEKRQAIFKKEFEELEKKRALTRPKPTPWKNLKFEEPVKRPRGRPPKKKEKT